jgi:hypothetical protein
MLLSVEDDELTAEPPTNDAVDRERRPLQNRIAVFPAPVCGASWFSSGTFAAIIIYFSRAPQTPRLG